MTKHVRWYVNIAKWTPTREEWLRLTSSVALEELQRINKFVFQDDSKSSLIGCALIRNFLSKASQAPSNDIILTRTPRGRPVVSEDYKKPATWPSLLDFNISHSGDYCVLAGVWSEQSLAKVRLGVDVTKIVRKNSKPELDRFLDLMSRRPFTRAEWETVEGATTDRQKCINFTRLWCLKESYIKAIGLGLAFKLQRIDFKFLEEHKWSLATSTLREKLLEGTTVFLDGQLATDWLFYETALDDEHIVALSYNIEEAGNLCKSSFGCSQAFQELDVRSIVSSLTPMRREDENDWTHFSSRAIKSNI